MDPIVRLRHEYEKSQIRRNNRIRLGIVIVVCITIFILSMVLKNVISNWYWIARSSTSGWGFYWTQYKTTEYFQTWLANWYWEGFNDSLRTTNSIDVWHIEAYVDAAHYYEPYLYSFRFLNWNPYAGGEGPLAGYAYGPMFIYGLYIISIFVSILNPGISNDLLVAKSVKWTHITFDSLSVVLLYIIITSLKIYQNSKTKKHVVGLTSALIFLFMPINLLYVDCIYLNIPQMTFFAMLSYLLFIKEKYKSSAFVLTLAWLSKQMPLFFLAPWFFILWKKKDLRTAMTDFLFTLTIFCIFFSIFSVKGYIHYVVIVLFIIRI